MKSLAWERIISQIEVHTSLRQIKPNPYNYAVTTQVYVIKLLVCVCVRFVQVKFVKRTYHRDVPPPFHVHCHVYSDVSTHKICLSISKLPTRVMEWKE
jgi:hypothetical protein